jgi:hypothetical protein
MTRSELEQAARGRQTVEAKVRNSTEMMKIVGKIVELTTVYGKKEKEYPVVVIAEERSNSIIRVAPEDVLRVIGGQDAEKRMGTSGGEDTYIIRRRVSHKHWLVLHERAGVSQALYDGYVNEERGVVSLYIKEPYVRNVAGKLELSLSLIGGGRRDAV